MSTDLQKGVVKGRSEIWVHYRFVELDGDVGTGRHLGICLGYGDEDTLRKDGACERCGIEKLYERLEHSVRARSDKGGGTRGVRLRPLHPKFVTHFIRR